jgi:hypothetical protein
MKNYCKVLYTENKILMDRTFYKKATIVGSPEYNRFQICKEQNPGCVIEVRTIKKNPNKQKYNGLTYFYMERYIELHENAEANRKEYDELQLIAQCHSKQKRYPAIKRWFLNTYPEVKEFGNFEVESLMGEWAPMVESETKVA